MSLTKGQFQKSPIVMEKNSPVEPRRGFLFVEPSEGKDGALFSRKNARSFVMQRARREKPWSTSKHAARRHASNRYMRRTPDGTTFVTVFANDSESISKSQPSVCPPPPTGLIPSWYPDDVSALQCLDCWRPGNHYSAETACDGCKAIPLNALSTINQAMCSKDGLVDPFNTLPVRMNAKTNRLIDHCECPL